MNASLDSVPSTTRQRVARDPAPAQDLTVREGILEVPGDISLYHGGKLAGMRIAWRMVGPGERSGGLRPRRHLRQSTRLRDR